ncbi:hypothetical protein VMCG_07697 [Cytospora schulzeri]|uniref:Uncharacterized protein n=1 Tax=Cytospora schulzeri TaxID=448051 RepID=A0A423VZ04_9PEZI|nr:hypothetical protein VMCG_07697 [Valsa malicola]
MATRPATDTQWTLVLALTALFLSAVVTAQILSAYAKAYMSAPAEVYTFVDAADSSVQENESYDRDVSRVRRLEDKLRLGRLLREIQKCGDDLREELSGVLMSDEDDGEGGDDVVMCGDLKDYRLTTTARVLWASKRRGLEDKVRRLDMLRMRFLVVYLGIVSNANAADNDGKKSADKKGSSSAAAKGGGGGEKFPTLFEGNCPPPPQMPPWLAEGINKKKPVARRLSRAIGHSDEKVEAGPRRGWAGVMMELQMSPLLHRRRASVEKSTSPKS